jgi:hypothetical protein
VIRLPIIIQPINSTLPAQPAGSGFRVTVLAAGNPAIVAAAGQVLAVRSEIPMQAGDSFLVTSEQAGTTVRWRISSTAAAPDQTAANEGNAPASAALNRIDLAAALKLAGVADSPALSGKIARLLDSLGGTAPLSDFLAAAAAAELGVYSRQLLEAILSFMAAGLQPGSGMEADEQALRQAVMQASGLAGQLQDLSKLLRTDKQKLEQLLQSFYQSTAGKELLGGELLASLQQKEHPFYYIPLFTVVKQELLRNSELTVWPPRTEQGEEPEQKLWRFQLTLETEALGWISFDMIYSKGELEVRPLAEQPSTKELLDRNWPLLEKGLRAMELRLHWTPCRLGEVAAPLKRLRQADEQLENYQPVNLFV